MAGNVDWSRLPRMVVWFKPALLLRALFHHMVAGIFGQYADQRVIQQLSDPAASGADQADKPVHDYSKECGDGEPFWVDYVCDLGDGFSSTYSVAYLLAADALRGTQTPSNPKLRPVRHLARHEVLTHGRVLILGGDQVYPWPSREAYAERLQLPYGLALPPPGPSGGAPCPPDQERDVYAIPGNHDWYDGLASFDDLFCRARMDPSDAACNSIGAWKARQRRSYFALKLPHNWWVWAADIQLSQSLDAGQLRYFQNVAAQMGPNDKFVLLTAQPTWLRVGTPAEMRTRQSLRELIDPPLKRGAKLCSILSGDTHHYSRYNENDRLGNFNLFIAGGGGAYIHGSHHLDNEIKMDWVGEKLSFRLDRRQKPVAGDNDTVTQSEPTSQRATYPTRLQSIRMALSNVLFPLRNLSFALSMGAIYWLVTWAVSAVDVERPLHLREKGVALERLVKEYRDQEQRWFVCDISDEAVANREDRDLSPGAWKSKHCYLEWKRKLLDLAQPRASDMESYQSRSAGSLAKSTRDLQEQRTRARSVVSEGTDDALTGAAPVRYWIMAESALFRAKMRERDLTMANLDWWAELWPLAIRTFYLLLAGLAGSPATAFIVAGLFVALWLIADSRLPGLIGRIVRGLTGTAHFLAHAVAMLMLFGYFVYENRHLHAKWIFNCAYNQESWLFGSKSCPENDGIYLGLPTFFWEQIILPFEMILIGGLIAGVIFGIYLAAGYILAGVNDDWAFSAQRSPNFRNFLRLKFEPDRLVVYPIGIDTPPRLRTRWSMSGWVEVENPGPGKPRVEPRVPIEPRLIEGPIVIKVHEVRNIPRKREGDGSR